MLSPHIVQRVRRGSQWLRGAIDASRDLHHSVVTLWRHLRLTLVVVLTLGMGVGSTAVVFGMVNHLLLRPVPGIQNPDRIARLLLRGGRSGAASLNLAEFDQLRQEVRSVEGMSSFRLLDLQLKGEDGVLMEVQAMAVHGPFFELLRLHPIAGELLDGEETGSGHDPSVVVLGERLGRQLFGDVKRAVGRALSINGRPATVVGVVGGGFKGPERHLNVEIWVPHSALAYYAGTSLKYLTEPRNVLHRRMLLRLGMHEEDAVRADIQNTLRRMAEASPRLASRLAGVRPALYSSLRVPIEEQARVLVVLSFYGLFVLTVLLIACANAATLILSRFVSRRQEFATRRALGASPARIVRQSLSQVFVLAVAGSIVGIPIGWLLTLPFRKEQLAFMPALGNFPIDERVFVFAGVMSLITLLLSGLLPAIYAGRLDIHATLREGGSSQAQTTLHLRQIIVTGQIALGSALLVSAILIARTMQNVYRTDTGVRVEDVWTLNLGPPDVSRDSPLQAPLYRDLIRRLEEIPALGRVALDRGGAFGGGVGGRVATSEMEDEQALATEIRPVSPGWFELLEVDFVNGRPFSEPDWTALGPIPVILSNALATRLFGSTRVSGRPLRLGSNQLVDGVIVGVTDDLRMPEALDRRLQAAFVPIGRQPIPVVTLSVRSSSALSRDRIAAVRRIASEFVRGAVLGEPIPLARRLDEAFAEQRIFSRLLWLMAGIAVGLTTIGLYSLLSLGLEQRRFEFGVRMAMGAGAFDIVRLVCTEMVRVTLPGILLGMLGAYVIAIAMRTWFVGVETIGPWAFVEAILLFVAVTLVAGTAPALAACRVSPMEEIAGGRRQ